MISNTSTRPPATTTRPARARPARPSPGAVTLHHHHHYHHYHHYHHHRPRRAGTAPGSPAATTGNHRHIAREVNHVCSKYQHYLHICIIYPPQVSPPPEVSPVQAVPQHPAVPAAAAGLLHLPRRGRGHGRPRVSPQPVLAAGEGKTKYYLKIIITITL